MSDKPRDQEGNGGQALPPDDAVPLELDGILDLHQFQPAQVKQLVPDWLDECRRAGLRDVRIIHGKGIGVLRTIVQKILAEHPAVASFQHPTDTGSWGATVARLHPFDPEEKSPGG